MAKQTWAGGNMLYPLPAVMVSCANAAGEKDIVTVAWAGTVCTNPPMLSISLRPERHSYHIVRESGEFVVNLVTTRLQRACDWCGVRSGRDYDKWEAAYTSSDTDVVTNGIWQYSSKNALRIAGFGNKLDCDVAYKDYPSIIRKAGLNGYGK